MVGFWRARWANGGRSGEVAVGVMTLLVVGFEDVHHVVAELLTAIDEDRKSVV